MTRRHLRPDRLAVALVVVLLAPLADDRQAAAQTMLGVDPYRPYNSGYIPFSVPPSPSSNYNALERSRIDGASRANQMGSFYDELYGSGGNPEAALRRSGPGVPYSAANRLYDKDFNRSYQPNSGDAQFYEDQKKRTDDYFNALHEPDPRKRAELLREIERRTLQSTRDLGPHARQANPTAARSPLNTLTRPAAPGTPGASAPRSPSSTPSNRDRRSPAANPTAPGEGSSALFPATDPLRRAGAAPTDSASRTENAARYPYYNPAQRRTSPFLDPSRRLASPFQTGVTDPANTPSNFETTVPPR